MRDEYDGSEGVLLARSGCRHRRRAGPCVEVPRCVQRPPLDVDVMAKSLRSCHDDSVSRKFLSSYCVGRQLPFASFICAVPFSVHGFEVGVR